VLKDADGLTANSLDSLAGLDGTLKRLYRFQTALLALLLAYSCVRGNAANWLPFGPDGGDARAITPDPQDHSHLYLGTANGWIYETRNSGAEWKRLARLGNRDDLVLDSIVVDASNPKHVVVGAWVLGSPDGGLYISNDGGVTWKNETEISGQSIRALAAAPSDPKILVAGTLKGVYQSTDGGSHWHIISPEGDRELHEVESIAIDPIDPRIIYAGTWHLPWKTVDGGKRWSNIKQGLIDDSDVFSIIVDPKQPSVVFASACSGIYKSEDAGEKFVKVQGIPSTARRTRVLMQDPTNRNIVFAGTTEGLYRTSDSGKIWIRTTGPEVIVNDVFVDPTNSNRLLLATDRGGVLSSNDGGNTFAPSNSGFSARQITSFVADSARPATIYVGVVNDKAWGGVFESDNAGLSWTQKNVGLEKHDVFSLGQAADGTLLAGTRHGIYRLKGNIWSHVDDVTLTLPTSAQPSVSGKSTASTKKSAVGTANKARSAAGTGSAAAGTRPASGTSKQGMASASAKHAFEATVFGFARSGDSIFAATSEGVLKSSNAGESWTLVSPDRGDWHFVGAGKSLVLAGALKATLLSADGGQNWTPLKLPENLTQVGAVAVDGSGGLWVGGREGIFLSEDQGATWQVLKNLYVRDVNSIFYDEQSQRVLVTANSSTTIAFAVRLPDKVVSYWNTGWNLRLLRPVGDHMLAATLFDGIVIQPQMVDSK
jgi:photosystem II stability/assembly factor-like uncharacterized protein